MIVDELGRIPMSPNLAMALQRASDYAAAQSHIEVTLEHLLLALTQDADAGQVLEASHVDISRLEADVSTHLGRIDDRYPPGQPVQLTVSAELKRILEASAAAAAKGRRREINGAIVLAAIVGDARTVAAHMLRAQGLTFEEAIRVLRAPPVPPRTQPPAHPQFEPASPLPPQPASRPAPPPQVQRADANTEDILAGARERVQTRARPLVMPPDEPDRSPQRTIPVAQQHPADPVPQPESEYVPEPELPSGYEDHDPPQPAYEPRFETLPKASWPAVGEDRGEPPGGREPPPFEPQAAPHLPAEPRWAPPPLPQPPQPAPAAMPPAGARGGGIGGPLPQSSHGPVPRNAPLHPTYMPPPAGQQRPQPPPPPMERPLDAPFPPRPMTPGATAPSHAPAHAPAPPQRPDPPAYAPWPEHPVEPRQSPPMAAEASRERNPTRPPADRRRAQPAAVEAGQLVENIPRRMRVAVPVVVETRIAKASVKALAEGMRGGGPVNHHDVAVTKAMSVKLRAPEGGFWIETASPETQWIENVSGLMSDDYASWRWTVTPRNSGRKRLQLVVSARTVATDGLTAETALPDQIIDVRVGINYAQTARRWGGWALAAVAGGLIQRFGEGAIADGLKSLIALVGG